MRGGVRRIDCGRTLGVAARHELARDGDRQKNPDQRENDCPLPSGGRLARTFHATPADGLIKRFLVRHDRDLLVSRLHRGNEKSLSEII